MEKMGSRASLCTAIRMCDEVRSPNKHHDILDIRIAPN